MSIGRLRAINFARLSVKYVTDLLNKAEHISRVTMEKLKRFAQFVEEKSAGLDSKAKVSLMADYTSKTPQKPQANGKYPNQPANTGSVLPYGNKGKDVGLVMAEPDGMTPLGQAKTLNMDPKKAAALGEPPAARPAVHKSSRKQLKEFVEATRNMSDAEFVSYLMEGRKERPSVAMVHDLHGEPFTPHPHEAMSFVTSLMHNPKMISRLVREVKRNGHLADFVAELMDHPEFYDEAVKMMGDKDEGRKITDKFARTMADHHSSFRKDAGLSESRRTFRQRVLSEKVGPSLVDGDEDAEYAGIPTSHSGGNPMMNPDGVAAEPGSDPSIGDTGQMDANGQEIGADMDTGDQQGIGDMGGDVQGSSGRPSAGRNMVQSIKGAAPNDFESFCADGSC